MLVECFEILIAAVIVAAVGLPAVMWFDKWKKKMDEEGKE